MLNFLQATATTSTAGPDGEIVCQCILEAFRPKYAHPHGEVDQGELGRTGDESACLCMHYVKLWRVVCVRACVHIMLRLVMSESDIGIYQDAFRHPELLATQLHDALTPVLYEVATKTLMEKTLNY